MLGALIGAAHPACAHALGERYELPAPVWLFVLGGALTVTVTFLIVAAFARAGAERYAEAHHDLSTTMLGRVLGHHATLAIVKAVGVALLMLALLAGTFGATDPNRNIAPTLVWIWWWVGLSYFAMLIGDVWPVLNPWRTLFDCVVRRRDPGRRTRAPARPGTWPALALLLVFGWIELVFPFKASPRVLAGLIALYSLVTWIGMARCGSDTWLTRVDPFARAFDLLARFAPFGPCATGGIAIRPYAAGLMNARRPRLDAAGVGFIIAMLAIVLFDGLLGSSHWVAIEDAAHAINPRLGDVGWILVHSAGLLGTWLLFLGLFYLAATLARRMARGGGSVNEIAAIFALALVPIAIGYHFAHTFTYLLVQGQSTIALISDPFGWGWNLFGTRDRKIDLTIIKTKTAWYLAFGAIVIGHAVSVYLAHIAAERHFASRGAALRALVPMTILMIVYTVISLQILAEPLVRYSGPQETII